MILASLDRKAIKFSTLCKSLLFFCGLPLLFSCGKSKIEIKGFDPIAWQQKRMVNAEKCISYRKENYKLLLDKQEELIGREDQEVLDFLGTPDKESLSGRLKKSKMYCIQGCEICEDSKFIKFLVIDFETFKHIKSVRIVVESK